MNHNTFGDSRCAATIKNCRNIITFTVISRKRFFSLLAFSEKIVPVNDIVIGIFIELYFVCCKVNKKNTYIGRAYTAYFNAYLPCNRYNFSNVDDFKALQ